MKLEDIELTAEEIARCNERGIDLNEFRQAKACQLTPEVDAALDAIHATFEKGHGDVCGPWQAEKHDIASICCIGDVEFSIVGNVDLNAAAAIRERIAEMEKSAEIIEALAAEVLQAA